MTRLNFRAGTNFIWMLPKGPSLWGREPAKCSRAHWWIRWKRPSPGHFVIHRQSAVFLLKTPSMILNWIDSIKSTVVLERLALASLALWGWGAPARASELAKMGNATSALASSVDPCLKLERPL